MYVTSVPDNAAFDYVIVGSGSAGCALANRLSADGRHQVLLLEAGGRDTHYKLHIPALVAQVLNDPRWIWPYLTEPQTHLNGAQRKWPRGRVVGGCSSINGNLFVRGDPLEYDKWRDRLGCSGWGWDDLLPYFKRLEDFPEGDPATRGRGGPIHCTRLDRFDALAEAFLGACGEAGYPVVEDYNDGRYEGAFYLQYTTRRGLRSSASVGYLKPVRNRANLTILTRATARRLLLEGKRATGVEVRVGEAIQRFKARREVVLAAGPLASPQLLELSGIGDATLLGRHGIPVVEHRPAVGENLRDHPYVRLSFECAQPVTINDVLRNPLRRLREGLRFIVKRQGILTISSSTAQMNYRSGPQATQAELVLRLMPLSGKDRYNKDARYGLDPFSGFSFGVAVLQPHSTGSVHIRSAEPCQPACMDPRYFSDDADARLFLEGVRTARRVVRMPALAPYFVREVRPGPEAADDAAVLDYMRNTAQTAWHMVGTCRMGGDADSVVDPQLRVRGIGGLRVVDSSVCPTIPASNTNIAAIAVGEKGADLMLATARG